MQLDFISAPYISFNQHFWVEETDWWRIRLFVGLGLEATVDAVPVGEASFCGVRDPLRDLLED